MPIRRACTAVITLSVLGVAVGCGGLSQSGKTLTSISVTPSSVPLLIAGTQQLTATATYSDKSTANVTSTVTWSSSNTAIATVNAGGVVTAVAAGSASVSAALSGQTGTASITVSANAPTVVSLTVTPSSASLTPGATEQLIATAAYNDGTNAIVTSKATWTSSSSSVASVNSGGLVTAAAVGNATITASYSGQSATSSIAVSTSAPTVVSLAVTPSSVSLGIGATQQLTATATYSNGSNSVVTASAAWSSSNSAAANVNSSGLVTGTAAGDATITASYSGQSGTSAITVNSSSGAGVNIPTWHNDNLRSGLNSAETALTPQNVNTSSFGKLYSYIVDGYLYAQPLFVSNVTINGAVHNVVYVATENDSVYAFDADNYGNGSPLWQVSLLEPNETPLTGAIQPVLGVTSTPAIDLTTNTMYVLSTEVAPGQPGTYRLHALNITNGAEQLGSPVLVTASVPGTNAHSINGVVYLTTSCVQRAALLVADGSIYIGFGNCWSGWLLSYDEQTLAQTGVFNMSPDLNGEGTYGGAGAVWMGGGGPAADSNGNIYVTTGNGPYDGSTAWGESVMKFNSTLQLLDHFTPFDYNYDDCADSDLASGGLLLIPGSVEAVAGGKKGMLYLVNTTDLGGEQNNDAGATQTLYFEPDLSAPYQNQCTASTGITYSAMINSYEIFGTAAYYNGSIYLGISPTGNVPAPARQFTYNGKLTAGPYTSVSILQGSYGTTPFISSNGDSSGIVWMIDHGEPLQNATQATPSAAVLRAFDASNLATELYNSSQNGSDVPGYGIKFTSPIVANGKVFIGTAHTPIGNGSSQGELDIYGLKQ